jgi:hypothetical protein
MVNISPEEEKENINYLVLRKDIGPRELPLNKTQIRIAPNMINNIIVSIIAISL